MRANCWYGKHDVRVEQVPDPKILNRRDAIVKISSTAICGSDLHLYNGFMPTMEKGDILGHEFMGEIVEAGPDLKDRKVGDRVVVSFPISCGLCYFCKKEMFSLCENSNPNAWMAEKMFGHSPAGIFGYSHLTGGYAGGQAEYARVPFADVGTIKVPECSHRRAGAFPFGYFSHWIYGRGNVQHPARRYDCRLGLWAGRPVRDSQRVSTRCRTRHRHRPLPRAAQNGKAGRAETINYEETSTYDALMEMTGGRGPDACIDAVGLEAHGAHGLIYAYDRVKQAVMAESDRPIALREAIMACRNGGIVSVIGVYGGLIDKFPIGSFMNRGLTMRTGQCHVQHYWHGLLDRIERGEIDPSFVITHKLELGEAAHGYDTFMNKEDNCIKVVLKP